MKKLKISLLYLSLSLLLGVSSSLFSQPNYSSPPPSSIQNSTNSPSLSASSSSSPSTSIRVINTRRCLEEAKMSKHERVTLEKMKSQMESVLKEKEKAIYEIESKLRDEDYTDNLSDEAERDLKHKKKLLIEEGMELNRQFSDNLEMTNMKIMQSIIEAISKASKEVAQEMASQNLKIDAIFSSEACTFYDPSLDITDRVLAKMDAAFDAVQKEQALKKA